MAYAHNVDGLIGNTALVELTALTDWKLQERDVRILGKYEATNPGGSIKDRVALAMIESAEREEHLRPGSTIIEPTSGNTGVGLAMLAAARGYQMILVMPDTMSVERRKLAASYGAQIVLTPGAEGMSGAVARAKEIADSTSNAIIAGQFENPANPQAHYETTGPEIWDATAGEVDVLVCGVGTGGTISGAARYLKERNPEIRAVAVEPAESPVLSGGKSGPHKIQGIGAGFVPATYDASVVDEVLPITSAEAIATKLRLAEELGLLVGVSSGAAVAAALQLAERASDNTQTIVTVLPDTGERYLSMDF